MYITGRSRGLSIITDGDNVLIKEIQKKISRFCFGTSVKLVGLYWSHTSQEYQVIVGNRNAGMSCLIAGLFELLKALAKNPLYSLTFFLSYIIKMFLVSKTIKA